MITKLRQIKI